MQRVKVRRGSRFQSRWNTHGQVPSKEAPYPALPRLPIIQNAGHRPDTSEYPGSLTDASKNPPEKQNYSTTKVFWMRGVRRSTTLGVILCISQTAYLPCSKI